MEQYSANMDISLNADNMMFTERWRKMTIDELFEKPLPAVPVDIAKKINSKNLISLTGFSNANEILVNPDLQQEIGYRKFEDGSYLVSMVCPMPDITAEMIRWWFWWHPQDSKRYQVWYPEDHFSISYSKKDKAYFTAKTCPTFRPNTQYPVERIGGMKMPLRIDFVSPEDFGFSKKMMEENDIPLIVCGHVGAYQGAVWHTEMAHIFKQTNDGLLLISRFWLGKTLKNPLLRKMILTDETARSMAEHCCVEYRSLVQILPHLYDERSINLH